MTSWTITFLTLALLSAAMGHFHTDPAAAEIAKVLFVLFATMVAASAIAGSFRKHLF